MIQLLNMVINAIIISFAFTGFIGLTGSPDNNFLKFIRA